MLRAHILLEQMALFGTEDRKRRAFFPRVLHILMPTDGSLCVTSETRQEAMRHPLKTRSTTLHAMEEAATETQRAVGGGASAADETSRKMHKAVQEAVEREMAPIRRLLEQLAAQTQPQK